MNVCILDPILDVFKGGNHLSLFAACKDTQFTIVTNRTNPKSPDLPSNTKVITLNKRSGPFYYGFAHFLYAHYLLKKYPVSSKFWKQFDLIHLNQTLSPQLKKLNKTGVPVLYSIHHPVSVDRMIAIKESTFLEGLRWRARYALLRKWQKMLCRKMPNIMTVSNSSSNQIKKDYKCKNKNINVVYNGVDGDIFTLGNKETNYDVIALGSFIHPRKGFKYLEKIYKELSSKGYCIADVGRRSNEQQNILNSIPNVTTFGTIDQDK